MKLIQSPVAWNNGKLVPLSDGDSLSKGREQTIAYQILRAHSHDNSDDVLRIRFDSLASHETTYVSIIQTAKAAGLKEFPVPYIMTNCHNSLCVEGGTINEDDHVYGFSAAKKYGGIFVPAHEAIMHQFVREMTVGCGKMILGSDSHTRYGAYGTMGIGEGGPELVKQMLCQTYDIQPPKVIAVHVTGEVRNGVGPQDVALALIKAVFSSGFVNNKILEFIGEGVSAMSADFRHGIDVMTTETTCLSTIWQTDERIRLHYRIHGREEDYRRLEPGEGACYDGAIELDLSAVVPMIALPFHPSNAYTVKELCENAEDILHTTELECNRQLNHPGIHMDFSGILKNGKIRVPQGAIAGCSGGTFENLCAAAAIIGSGNVCIENFTLNIYAASTPILSALLRNGAAASLTDAGAVIKTCFCGPCFGAGDVPANNMMSIRHVTRNFANREGSHPAEGQIASVALMDARSIAATAKNGGYLTPATVDGVPDCDMTYHFEDSIYKKCVYNGFRSPKPAESLVLGPNITDWPDIPALPENLLVRFGAVIHDPVTTTDELIPSGEFSTYRSNPNRMAEFTLMRREPAYLNRAKDTRQQERRRAAGETVDAQYTRALAAMSPACSFQNTGIGSGIYATKPGDGSAREYAASCQRVLGSSINIAHEYATKRYRSNLINWGIIPFTVAETPDLAPNDFVLLVGIREALASGKETITALVFGENGLKKPMTLHTGTLLPRDREILLAGSLIGYYREQMRNISES